MRGPAVGLRGCFGATRLICTWWTLRLLSRRRHDSGVRVDPGVVYARMQQLEVARAGVAPSSVADLDVQQLLLFGAGLGEHRSLGVDRHRGAAEGDVLLPPDPVHIEVGKA